jgi:hypothetical protein
MGCWGNEFGKTWQKWFWSLEGEEEEEEVRQVRMKRKVFC